MTGKSTTYYEVILIPRVGSKFRTLARRYKSESGAKAKARRMAENDPNVAVALVNRVTATIYPSMPQRDRVFRWDRSPLFEVISN